jgi:hypothetical protein
MASVSSSGMPATWARTVTQSAQLRPGTVLPFFGL